MPDSLAVCVIYFFTSKTAKREALTALTWTSGSGGRTFLCLRYFMRMRRRVSSGASEFRHLRQPPWPWALCIRDPQKNSSDSRCGRPKNLGRLSLSLSGLRLAVARGLDPSLLLRLGHLVLPPLFCLRLDGFFALLDSTRRLVIVGEVDEMAYVLF